MEYTEIPDHLVKVLISFLNGYYEQRGSVTGQDILVTAQYPDREEEGEKRPRVVVKRGGLGWLPVGISNDFAGRDVSKGITHTSSLVRSNPTIFGVSSVGIEAGKIANEIFNTIFLYHDDLHEITKGFIHSLISMDLGDEEPIKIEGDTTEYVQVPVSVSLACSVHMSYSRHSGQAKHYELRQEYESIPTYGPQCHPLSGQIGLGDLETWGNLNSQEGS